MLTGTPPPPGRPDDPGLPRLKHTQSLLLNVMCAAGPGLDLQTLAAHSGLSQRTVQRLLGQLAGLGLVQRTRRYCGWQITPVGRQAASAGAPRGPSAWQPLAARGPDDPSSGQPHAGGNDAARSRGAASPGQPGVSSGQPGAATGQGRTAGIDSLRNQGEASSGQPGVSSGQPDPSKGQPFTPGNDPTGRQGEAAGGSTVVSSGRPDVSSGQPVASSGQNDLSSGQGGPLKEVVDSLTASREITTTSLPPAENAPAPAFLPLSEMSDQVQVALILNATPMLFGEPVLRAPGKSFDPGVLLAWCAQINTQKAKIAKPARVVFNRLRDGTPPDEQFLRDPFSRLPRDFLQAAGLPAPPLAAEPEFDDPDDDLFAGPEDAPAPPPLADDPLIRPDFPGASSPGKPASQVWEEAVATLSDQLPWYIAHQHLEPLVLLAYLPEEGLFRARAPSPEAAALLAGRFAPSLQRALTGAAACALKVEFVA